MNGAPTPGTAVTATWVRFLALAVAVMLGWKLAVSLARLPAPGSVNSRQIMSAGVLLSMISVIVSNRRAKLVLAVGGLVVVVAGYVLRIP